MVGEGIEPSRESLTSNDTLENLLRSSAPHEKQVILEYLAFMFSNLHASPPYFVKLLQIDIPLMILLISHGP